MGLSGYYLIKWLNKHLNVHYVPGTLLERETAFTHSLSDYEDAFIQTTASPCHFMISFAARHNIETRSITLVKSNYHDNFLSVNNGHFWFLILKKIYTFLLITEFFTLVLISKQTQN